MYGGEICVSNSIGLVCSGKEIYHFCFALLCIRGQIPSTSSPGGLYSEGRFNGGFFALRFWGLIFGGACTCRGLFSEFYGSRSPYVRESKTGFPSRHSGFHSMDSGSQVLYSSLSVELGSRIPILSGIQDSLSYILDPKAQESGFQK